MDLPSELLQQTVSRGDILHSDMFGYIDHSKFFVVIGVDDKCVVGFFFINSRINKFLENKQEQFNLQYIIRPSDYDFLSHDSFVNASSLERISLSEIVESIKEGRTIRKGKLTPQHISVLLDLVRNSKIYNKIDKKRFFS